MFTCQQNAEENVLNLCVEYFRECTSPQFQAESGYEFEMLSHQFETIVEYGKNNTYTPSLATSWEVNDNYTIYRFKINTKKRFSDGEYLEARHIKEAWKNTILQTNHLYSLTLSFVPENTSFKIIKFLILIGISYINSMIITKHGKILFLIHNFFLKKSSEIEQAITQVQAMIDDILDYSREIKFDVDATDVSSLLSGLLRQTSFCNNSYQITIHYEYKAKFLPLMNPVRMTRVFTNIIN